MKFVKGLLFLAAFPMLVGAAYFAVSVGASPVRSSANGHGTLLVPENATGHGSIRRQFSFSAVATTGGAAKGNAVLHNPAFTGANDQVYQLQIRVTCLKIVDNYAIISGFTRRTNDPNLVDAVVFSVQDNGEPGQDNDLISPALFFDDDPNTTGPADLCQGHEPNDIYFAGTYRPIESGNVNVSE